jgi:hypothetical protein
MKLQGKTCNYQARTQLMIGAKLEAPVKGLTGWL